MQAKFLTAVLLSFVLIAASACSGGGNDTAKLTELEERVKAAEEAAAEAERKRKEAEAETEQAREKPEEPVEEPVEEPAEEVEEAEDETEEVEEPKAQQQAQTLEANQRAEKILDVLKATSFASNAPASDRVDISVPTRNKLTFEQSDYKVSFISAPDLRGAKLTRTRGDTQTTVVYTDIELSQKLVDRSDYVESTVNLGQFTLPTGVFVAGTTNFIARSASTEPVPTRLSITHGFSGSIAASATERSPTNTKAAFSGSVHGVSGTFVCEGENCMLTATGTYNPAEAQSNPNRLSGVTLDVSAGATLYFKPSGTGAVSLCADTAQCLPADTAYMAFGWWRSEPTSVQGSYEFEPFFAGMGLVEPSAVSADVIKAEYNGTAVGMYVEQQQEGSAIAKKQGEFVADARLDWDGTDLTGTIDGFKTTPTGGSGAPSTAGNWIVNLNASNATELVLLGPDGDGTWRHMYVPDGSAVVGVFEAGQAEVLHIAGAFGAQ